MIVQASRGEVDPATGKPVTAEPIATPKASIHAKKVTESKTYRRHGTAVAERSKAVTTPRGTWDQDGVHGDRVRPLPQEPIKVPLRGLGGRGKASPKERGGGLLKSMFERARSKISEKENIHIGGVQAAIQDVADIVLACAPDQDFCGSGIMSPKAPTPEAIVNPFAKRNTVQAPPLSHTKFVTPVARGQGGSLGSDRILSDYPYTGAGADAWSRLSSSCTTSKSGGGQSYDDAVSLVEDECLGFKGIGRETGIQKESSQSAFSVAPVNKGNKKRSTPTSGSKVQGRKKRGKVPPSPSPSVGKGKTLLSFFGRSTACES